LESSETRRNRSRPGRISPPRANPGVLPVSGRGRFPLRPDSPPPNSDSPAHMGHRTLAAAVADLERAGQLVRVEQEIDPHLEAAEVHRRVYAAGGPAVF